MGIPEADWKNQPRHILDWVILLVGMGLLALYAYLWWVEPLAQYLGAVIMLFIAGIVYFTTYWQPILYLVLSVVFVVFMVVWIVDGSWRQLLIQLAIFLNSIFIILGIYLFSSEEAYGTKKAQT